MNLAKTSYSNNLSSCSKYIDTGQLREIRRNPICGSLRYVRTGILDYLREDFPGPARPFKHAESNVISTSVKIYRWHWCFKCFTLPLGPGLADPPHIYVNVVFYIYREGEREGEIDMNTIRNNIE